MKSVYVDSSILVSILFQEKAFLQYIKALNSYDIRLSSYLLEAELFAAAKREGIEIKDADKLLASISLVVPNRHLRPEYERIFQYGYCRGADACYLATALFLDPDTRGLHFLTADHKQAQLAGSIGFQRASELIK